jgi:FkbM family methyltransferase
MFKFLKRQSKLEKNFKEEEIENLPAQKYGVRGTIAVENKSFTFHDARCFYDTYQEVIKNKIYRFNTTSAKPYIIDCGANMGLSVYFFSKEYPGAEIVAFEPEEEIFEVLEKNIQTYGLNNVKAYKKAVWDAETTLEFFTDKGMGGSVENRYKNQEPAIVETVRLLEFLHKKTDLLKLDIEGSEYVVLKDCAPLLKNVENLFVEYHSYINKEQELGSILQILRSSGFRYHLKESYSRKMPFTDRNLACENMDMAINIFAYRS